MSGFAPLGSVKGTAGNGLGLGAIAGGLGALLQGFLAGKQLKLQNQQSEQTLQDDRLRNSLSAYDLLGHLGESSPQLLQNPQFLQSIKGLAGQGGLPLPQDPQGNIDTQAFRPSLQGLLSNPTALEAFSRYPTEIKQQVLANYGGTDEQKKALLASPSIPTGAQESGAITDMSRINMAVANGQPLTGAVLDQYNADRKMAGLPPITDASQGPQISVKTQAGIGKTEAQTQMLKLRIGAFPAMNQAQLGNLLARTGLTREQMAVLPTRVAAEMTRASAAMESADATSHRVAMEADSFQKLGLTPAAAGQYLHIASNFQTAANQQRIAADAAGNAIKAFIASHPGADAPPQPGDDASTASEKQTYAKLSHEVQTRTNAYNTFKNQHKSFMDGMDAFAKKVQQSVGGRDSWTAPRGQHPAVGPYGMVAHDPKTGIEYKWNPAKGQYLDQNGKPAPQ